VIIVKCTVSVFKDATKSMDIPYGTSCTGPRILLNLGLLASNIVCLLTSAAYDTWIIDSGASDHMTSHYSLVHTTQEVSQPCFITTPNGKQAVVTHIG